MAFRYFIGTKAPPATGNCTDSAIPCPEVLSACTTFYALVKSRANEELMGLEHAARGDSPRTALAGPPRNFNKTALARLLFSPRRID